MSHQFLRFPPDSTGKRVAHRAFIDIEYNGGTIPFEEGQVVTTPTSNILGTVIEVLGSTASGAVYLLLDKESPSAVVDGEAIQVNGVTFALAVGTGTPIFVPHSTLVGGNDPLHSQYVDRQGAAFVRFAEGSPQFDAFGHLQVSQQTPLADYIPTYDILAEDFTDKVVGTASIAHLSATAGVVISCGTGATDAFTRTSNKYFKYQAGVSQLAMMTVAVGDAGKANVTRTWGYGDEDDGLFFQLDGSTLNVVRRSSVTGSVVELKVPQSQWTIDRLDGSKGAFNVTGLTLDVTKDNIYFVDFQWLGAGRVRFGVVINGVRIVCHELHHANNVTASYMRTGSLPLRVEQINSGVSASTSEIRVWGLFVMTEGLEFSPPELHFSSNSMSLATVNSNTVFTHIFSGRAGQQHNGIDFRGWILPENLSIYVAGDPIILEFVKNPTLTGATWNPAPFADSGAEIAMGGTVGTDGRVVASKLMVAGINELNVEPGFGHFGEVLTRKADIALAPHYYTIRARNIETGKTSQVMVSMNWKEIH